MKKILLLVFATLFVASFTSAQNNGGGCRKAIAITPGTYMIDSFVSNAATYSNIDPYPNKAKW